MAWGKCSIQLDVYIIKLEEAKGEQNKEIKEGAGGNKNM